MGDLTNWAETRDKPYLLADEGRADEARALAWATVEAAHVAFGGADARLVEAYDVVIALEEGRPRELIAAMRKRLTALESTPTQASRLERAHQELGHTLAATGMLDEAKPHLERRIRKARGEGSSSLSAELIRLGLTIKPLALERADLREYCAELLAEGVALARTHPIERELRASGLAAYADLLRKAGAKTEAEALERERHGLGE
jgi:hypothetical protein